MIRKVPVVEKSISDWRKNLTIANLVRILYGSLNNFLSMEYICTSFGVQNLLKTSFLEHVLCIKKTVNMVIQSPLSSATNYTFLWRIKKKRNKTPGVALIQSLQKMDDD